MRIIKSIKIIVSTIVAATVIILGSSLSTTAPVPPGAIGPYLNGSLPSTSPGVDGSWSLEDPFVDIQIASPVGIMNMPNSTDILVLSKRGEIWQVAADGSNQKLLLDISVKTFNLSDAGALGMVLHPHFGDPLFPDDQYIFMYYKTKPNATEWDVIGFSVLSKFKWDDALGKFDENSEEKLIQQYDRYPWHNGGPMFFGPDGFLYFSVGDEGADEFQVASTQRLDGGFFNGVFRIDVDNDMTRSHPIIRQPVSNAAPPEGWGMTFSQGYSIPNDNPWLSPDGTHLEEYYALGTRSPFTIEYDEESGDIWLTDTGSDVREEINRVQKGDNLQWPYKEGTVDSEVHDKPTDLIGQEKPPYFQYERDYGTCIVGGALYRNVKFPSLYDKYIYADFTANKIAAITTPQSSLNIENQVLISNITNEPVRLPAKPGVTGVHELDDGRVLITVLGEDNEENGSILELKRNTIVDDPATMLSDLGVFTDMNTLDVIQGLIPYTVNSPLWSDGAAKKRWIAVPNDGSFNQSSEKIKFDSVDPWQFPKGTVFVKHFELPLTSSPDGPTKRLETRFLIIAENGKSFGLTYKWNESGTDAELLRIGDEIEVEISEADGSTRVQTWDFPSRSQCLSCHTSNAEYVLGVNTLQLNGKYPHDGQEVNQLHYFDELDMFDTSISNPSNYQKLSNVLSDDASLENRIRSYLDANCASCHREGGLPTVFLDFRYTQTTNISKYFDLGVQSHASTEDGVIIRPGTHQDSEIWVRDASDDSNQMPPLGRNLVDQVYVDSLAKWIDNIDPEQYKYHDLIVYPNPATDWINVHASDDWEGPYEYSLYSISGRPVRFIKSPNISLVIATADLPRGSYVVSVTAGDKRKSKKIVLQ